MIVILYEGVRGLQLIVSTDEHPLSLSVLTDPDSFFMPPYVEFTSDDLDTNKQLMEQSQVQYPFGTRAFSSSHKSRRVSHVREPLCSPPSTRCCWSLLQTYGLRDTPVIRP